MRDTQDEPIFDLCYHLAYDLAILDLRSCRDSSKVLEHPQLIAVQIGDPEVAQVPRFIPQAQQGSEHSVIETQWIIQPFTGPPCRNCSGVIKPSRLNTSPSFITNNTVRSASMSASGFPFTAIMSAGKPALSGP